MSNREWVPLDKSEGVVSTGKSACATEQLGSAR
jgi:hypothetical protein